MSEILLMEIFIKKIQKLHFKLLKEDLFHYSSPFAKYIGFML